ncbi:MAG TPA: DUF2203 family protein [Fimbriiglobus sp.]|nr:DUF2203 family protein [Fimbriiglobus sp.]
MSSSPNRASRHPAGKPRKPDLTLDLPTARLMLPLVRSIVADIVDTRHRLTGLSAEQDALDSNRRGLGWADRQRRYTVHEDVAQAEKHLTGAVAELSALGLTLIDSTVGQVDFPTRINGRPASFSWRLGEEGVGHWRYAGEEHRRPIPTDWQPGAPLRTRGGP